LQYAVFVCVPQAVFPSCLRTHHALYRVLPVQIRGLPDVLALEGPAEPLKFALPVSGYWYFF
jgi:hypothetical protein